MDIDTEDIYTKVRWKWAMNPGYLGLSQVLYKNITMHTPFYTELGSGFWKVRVVCRQLPETINTGACLFYSTNRDAVSDSTAN